MTGEPVPLPEAIEIEVSRLEAKIKLLRSIAENPSILSVYEHAHEVFGPSALHWMMNPAPSLGRVTPLEFALQGNCESVIQLINAINYGVYL